MHLTKRFGIVGASQLPAHYLLSYKSPYSPFQLLLRSSHESVIAIHQLLGRIIITLFYLHVTFYSNVFVQKGILAKLMQSFIICGIIGAVAFTIIGTTALAPIRRRNYRLFYVAHVAWSTIVLPVLYFHVHHIRLYIWETLLVYLVNVALRYMTSTSVTGTLKRINDTKLVEIDIPLPRNSSLGEWQTAQHAYISVPGHPFLRTFRSNPFSVASLPAIDGRLRFVARVLDGNTKLLAQASHSDQRLNIEGPYGLTSHADRLLQYDRVLFVAGGIGATFIVPLYRQLLLDLSPSKGSHRRQKVNFLWVARAVADVTWALPIDAKEREGFTERMHVYLTKDMSDVSTSETVPDYAEDDGLGVAGTQEGIELEEQKELLPNDANSAAEKNAQGLAVHAGRPDLGKVVAQVFSGGSAERVAIVVCGPRGLSQTLRERVAPWVRHGRDVWYWEESFAL